MYSIKKIILLQQFWALSFTIGIAQNVGIGVANPQQRLHVGGTLRLDSLPAPAGTQRIVQVTETGDLARGPRCLYGRVEADGSISGGSGGFVVTKTGTGLYRLTFQTPFLQTPSITVSAYTLEVSTPPCPTTLIAGCPPTYLNGSCLFGDNITNFSTTGGLTNISNPSSCTPAPGYVDYTASQTVTVPFNGSFNFSVTSNPSYSKGYRIWIDVNRNGLFEATESYFNTTTAGYGTVTGTINTAGIPCGVYRLRVRNGTACTPTAAQGCGNTCSTYGEAEDYRLVINPGVITTRFLAHLVNASADGVDVQITLPTGANLADGAFHFQVIGE
jgi:hypothetical protein